MNVAIVGLPNSGKTSIFNAVTRATAEVAPYAGPQNKPNMAVAKVPDHRLGPLQAIYKAKRQVPAEVIYADIPGGFGTAQGISGESLNQLQGASMLMTVVRAFEDPAVPHDQDSIDPWRDMEALLSELALADLLILERRLARLSESFKGAKAPEREELNREQALLDRLQKGLEAEKPLRDQPLSKDEARHLEGFGFLTAKPVIVVVNLGEDQLSRAADFEAQAAGTLSGAKVGVAAFCGKLEMELAQMDPEDEEEFRESLGASESGLARTLDLYYKVADLTTFLTGGEKEVRAWPVPTGTPALKAAGKVHSDMERGFIRAEVVAFDNLAEAGSVAESRKRGVLRQEGKSYLVQNGDVINFLFNV